MKEDTGHSARSAPDVASELSDWAVGGGIITIALFPLAIPIIALTAVALLPFALVPLVAALAAAVVMPPVLLARGLARRLRR
jgi:hypothetical protein